MPMLMEIYTHAPFALKRLFANAEAIRRDSYRKYKGYEELCDSINFNSIMSGEGIDTQSSLIEEILISIKMDVEYYRDLPDFNTLQELPLISKEEYRLKSKKFLADGLNRKHCWVGKTSGSTGTPLSFLNYRDTVRTVKAYQEKFLDDIGISLSDRSARISGVLITTFNREKPPYWIYIDKYKQLQLSPYHISQKTFSFYIDAMKTYKVSYGKGYPNSWLFLAEYLSSTGIKPPRLKAIITDSEGVTSEQQKLIEYTFECPVYQTYGLGEIGQIGVQCSEGHYHIIPTLCYAEIVDEDSMKLPNGQRGEIVLTNLVSAKTPIVRYRTGDYGTLEEGVCLCGWKTQYLTNIDGRLDDYVIGKDGRQINRLSHVIKPAVGVMESQIIQEKLGEIRLMIVPGKDFKASSMKEVVSNAQNFLGDMEIKWELVPSLERTKNAKVRRVVRKME